MSCFSGPKVIPKATQAMEAPPTISPGVTFREKKAAHKTEECDATLMQKMPFGMWLIKDDELYRCKFCKENDPENPLARGAGHVTELSCTLHVHKNELHKAAEDRFVALAYQEIVESLEVVATHLNNFRFCFKAQDYKLDNLMKILDKTTSTSYRQEAMKVLLEELRVCFKSAGRALVEAPKGSGVWNWRTATATRNFLKFMGYTMGQEYKTEEGLIYNLMANSQHFSTIVPSTKWDEYKQADQAFKVNIVALIKGLELQEPPAPASVRPPMEGA